MPKIINEKFICPIFGGVTPLLESDGKRKLLFWKTRNGSSVILQSKKDQEALRGQVSSEKPENEPEKIRKDIADVNPEPQSENISEAHVPSDMESFFNG